MVAGTQPDKLATGEASAKEPPPNTLRQNPELAQKIGFLLGDYANLEYQLFVVYAALATAHMQQIQPTDVAQCFSAFFKLRSINNKCGLLLDQAAPPRFDEARYRACQRVCRRIKGAAKRRTEVAHCIYLRSPGGQVWWLSSATTEPAFKQIPVDYFERTHAQFRTLSQDILRLVGFLVRSPEALTSLLRAIPVPPGTLPPPKIEVPPGPPAPHEIAQQVASLGRLGLLHLIRP